MSSSPGKGGEIPEYDVPCARMQRAERGLQGRMRCVTGIFGRCGNDKTSKAVHLRNIVYPRVHLAHPLVGKGSYKNFLGDLLKIRGNKNVLALLKKDEIDSEFERQLKSILDDESLVQKFMKTDVRQLRLLTYTNKADSPSKARSEQTKRQFADVQGILSTTTHAVAVSDEVQALNLPHFGNHPKTSKYDIFDRQIYNDFAPKAVKNNPDIVFPEKSMDEAFEMVAKRFRRTTGQRRTRREQFERMMRRCLGKESREHWEKGDS